MNKRLLLSLIFFSSTFMYASEAADDDGDSVRPAGELVPWSAAGVYDDGGGDGDRLDLSLQGPVITGSKKRGRSEEDDDARELSEIGSGGDDSGEPVDFLPEDQMAEYLSTLPVKIMYEKISKYRVRCLYCKKEILRTSSIGHTLSHQEFYCFGCKKIYKNQEELDSHVLLCEKRCELNEKNNKRKAEKITACVECGKIMNRYSIRRHMQTAHSVILPLLKVSIPVCAPLKKDGVVVDGHKKIDVDDLPPARLLEQLIDDSSDTGGGSGGGGGKITDCSSYLEQKTYNGMVYGKCSDGRWECLICKSKMSKSSMYSHYLVHNKNTHCYFCRGVFLNKEKLDLHQRTCEKKLRHDLLYKERTTREVECPTCHKKISHKGLQIHQEIQHGVK